MKEYIEREALMFDIAAKFEKHYGKSREQSIHDFYKFVIKKTCAAPAADVVEVRHGRWEAWMPDKNGETREFICTGCRFMVEMSWKQKKCDYEWCPYCGALMDKEE